MATKKKKERPEDVRLEYFSRSLRVQLTPQEVADRADRAAERLAEADRLESELKAEAKQRKAAIEAVEADLRNLSNEVRTRSTYQPVECERWFNYKTGRVTERRIDTGEQLEDRAMHDYELQRQLFETNGQEEEAAEEATEDA